MLLKRGAAARRRAAWHVAGDCVTAGEGAKLGITALGVGTGGIVTSLRRVLVLDNYDSFTYNLAHLIGALGAEPIVVRNDAIDLSGIAALAPTHIVLSPGPGRPEVARDFGICGAALLHFGPMIPILGVCLGHQGIVHRLGGTIVQAPRIMHGKRSRIRHDGRGLFSSVAGEIEVMRYHSLITDRAALPPCLRVTAETVDDGVVMAVAHESWPTVGVQFHPESVGTPDGRVLMANFLGVRA